MDQQPATPDGAWIASWFIANAPWIFAGLASGAVRFVYRWGIDGRPYRQAISEALLCAAIVSVLSPVAASLGFDKDWAMVIGVSIGFAGPEVVRNAIVDRIAVAAKALFKGK